MLQGKRIILGITGSIAAVKAPVIARELMRQGAEVHAALTPGALQFTTKLALSALTRQEAIADIFPEEKEKASDAGTWHVHLARSADAMLIAPCSATTIGKLRAGIYDNAVTLLAASLRRETPLVIMPAMDEEMWMQPAVQENLAVLREQGVHVIEPVSGPLASGLIGKGRMPEPIDVVEQFGTLLGGKKQLHLLSGRRPTATLEGKKVLITGGPTHEPIDPVRFIGNRSSGKMAAALSHAAEELGAEVTLIMGPSHVSTNGHTKRINIETADEMRDAVRDELPDSDIIIMNAAVSDFTPDTPSKKKLKKREVTDEEGELNLKLKRTPDVLSEIARGKTSNQILVGFALETGEAAEDYARGKLTEKGLDMIVLNRADELGAGFGVDTNKVIIFTKDGNREELPMLSKEECAREIFKRILNIIGTTDAPFFS